jgi:hypothetical protein
MEVEYVEDGDTVATFFSRVGAKTTVSTDAFSYTEPNAMKCFENDIKSLGLKNKLCRNKLFTILRDFERLSGVDSTAVSSERSRPTLVSTNSASASSMSRLINVAQVLTLHLSLGGRSLTHKDLGA